MFYVAPLALIALLALSDRARRARPRRACSSRPRARRRRRCRVDVPVRPVHQHERARSDTLRRCCRGGGCRITGSDFTTLRFVALAAAVVAVGARSSSLRRRAFVALPAARRCRASSLATVERRERPARDPRQRPSARSSPASRSRTATGSTAPSGATPTSRSSGLARGDVAHRLGERVLQPQRRTRSTTSNGPTPGGLPETPVHERRGRAGSPTRRPASSTRSTRSPTRTPTSRARSSRRDPRKG